MPYIPASRDMPLRRAPGRARAIRHHQLAGSETAKLTPNRPTLELTLTTRDMLEGGTWAETRKAITLPHIARSAPVSALALTEANSGNARHFRDLRSSAAHAMSVWWRGLGFVFYQQHPPLLAFDRDEPEKRHLIFWACVEPWRQTVQSDFLCKRACVGVSSIENSKKPLSVKLCG